MLGGGLVRRYGPDGDRCVPERMELCHHPDRSDPTDRECGMGAYLELLVSGTADRVPLDAGRVVIGQSSTNDVPLPFDPTVSRLHAILDRLPSGWCIQDLNSRNGTFVNGERVWGECPIRPGDEIRVGATTLVFRLDSPAESGDATAGAGGAPELTRRERDVLLALCAPLASGEVFRQPASIRRIAADLVVTEAAVKQHLGRLYDKFDLHAPDESRRVQLANEVIRRGALSMAEIREWVRSRS